MSNIHQPKTNPLLRVFVSTVIDGIKYASLMPLINMFCILKNYRTIRRNKEISKSENAFLVKENSLYC